ncbi:MAG: hypothetical protein RLZZ362_1489, partial [Actinomycetota bacterium]
MSNDLPDLELFRKEARAWLEDHAAPLPEAGPADDEDAAVVWGVGSDDVSVFHNIDHETERARL